MSASSARVVELHDSLECHGIQNVRTIYWNSSTPLLYEELGVTLFPQPTWDGGSEP